MPRDIHSYHSYNNNNIAPCHLVVRCKMQSNGLKYALAKSLAASSPLPAALKLTSTSTS